jgi:oligopeptide/dipeptide ABC transporter ATP-binding protein
VNDLTVDLQGADVQPGLVEGVSFAVYPNRTLALIGESGCGKTITAMSVLGLLPEGMHVSSGSIMFDDQDLLGLKPRELREVRGSGIGMIFQDPMSSLNPTTRVGDQIIEARRLHIDEPKAESAQRAVELLDLVGIPNAARRVKAYPFEMSGGMQQRVMIAMSIACEPKLLIADEPTTALDVTIQAEILDLLATLQQELGMGVLLVTHDLGVVADFADDVAVMYAGHVVEYGSVREVFHHPQHPYAQGLLDSMPQGAEPRSQLAVVPGRVPMAGQFPAGCRFQARCPHVDTEACIDSVVSLAEVAPEHLSRCVLVQRGQVQLPSRSGRSQIDV